ncbi:hypothetical protein COV82_06075 [Candidatus Peregrinibacteria bacterium CG11_big_fil_rev_8_21_14_0_20_46_8]|nr:MAG: hypothetical protein COV82_06075 [Candidatus Peregrinibacteria bacterium CG11_big_fil_rev_8_21_14_0_20_46_8]
MKNPSHLSAVPASPEAAPLVEQVLKEVELEPIAEYMAQTLDSRLFHPAQEAELRDFSFLKLHILGHLVHIKNRLLAGKENIGFIGGAETVLTVLIEKTFKALAEESEALCTPYDVTKLPKTIRDIARERMLDIIAEGKVLNPEETAFVLGTLFPRVARKAANKTLKLTRQNPALTIEAIGRKLYAAMQNL